MPTLRNCSCRTCGREFTQMVSGPGPVHCSAACRADEKGAQYVRAHPSREADIACAHCGATFRAPSRLGRTPRFCSNRCRTRAATARAALRRQAQYDRVPSLAVTETGYTALALASAALVVRSRLTELQLSHYRRLRSSVEDFDEGLTALGFSLRQMDQATARDRVASARTKLIEVASELESLASILGASLPPDEVRRPGGWVRMAFPPAPNP